MRSIVIVVVGTFILTALWQYLAARKSRANQLLMVGAMIKEMEKMAGKLGYSSLKDYFAEAKGSEYADTVMVNLRRLVTSFTPEGPGSEN